MWKDLEHDCGWTVFSQSKKYHWHRKFVKDKKEPGQQQHSSLVQLLDFHPYQILWYQAFWKIFWIGLTLNLTSGIVYGTESEKLPKQFSFSSASRYYSVVNCKERERAFTEVLRNILSRVHKDSLPLGLEKTLVLIRLSNLFRNCDRRVLIWLVIGVFSFGVNPTNGIIHNMRERPSNEDGGVMFWAAVSIRGHTDHYLIENCDFSSESYLDLQPTVVAPSSKHSEQVVWRSSYTKNTGDV